MSPDLLPWWGWLITAVVLWLAVNLTPDEKWFARWVMIIGSTLSALIGIVRFVKWAWSG